MSKNIFSDYDPTEIKRRIDNYLAATYSLKLAAESLQRKAAMRTKSNPIDTGSFQQQNNNANNFALATKKLADLTKQFNTNFKINHPSIPIPPMPR